MTSPKVIGGHIGMAPPEADVFVRSSPGCRFFRFSFRFCMFFLLVLDTVHKCLALYTYSRQALLDIAAQNWKITGQIPPELQHIVRPESHRHHPHEGPEPTTSSEYADPRIALRRRRRKRGKRGGLHARLKARASRPPLPSLLLANVRSLENKLDELRARITSQREIRECCALIFSETWLSETVPDSAVQLETHSLHRGDRTAASGKMSGGGVCVYVNNSWCMDVRTVYKHCSQDLEFLLLRCRPFYLPREFTCVFLAAVYIHPRANYTAALSKLYDVISALETAHPDAVFIVAGDFNQCNLRTVLTKYHQHVDIPTRGKNTLDHVYSNIRGGLKAARRPSFGDSDHISLFMYPAYRQRLKQSDPVSRQVQLWTPEAESTLQDCFATTDWDVFRAAATLEDSSVSIDDYAEYVTGYIHTCIENIVPIIQVRKFPNQKPWVNSEVLQMLRARSVAFKSGDETELKVAQYKLKKAIRSAKRQHREKTERLYSTADPRRMWQCLDQITDFRSRPGNIISSSGSLPDDLNAFYTRFETPTPTTPTEYTHTSTTRPPSPPPVVSSAQVHKALRRINPRKATGPDNIPGRALRACANELADVFTSIFNLSLRQCTVPTCYKTTTVVPLPKKNPPSCLNDYRPVALTPIIMKCFERVVLSHIQSSIPNTTDPLQYAYRSNRSTSDAIAAALHVSLSHLENKDSYVRILFIDYSSAFNTVVPHRLTYKLSSLGLHPTLCDWLLSFLTGRPQSVRIGNRTSAIITTNIGTPQGCVLSPILYTLFTHDCVATHPGNIILKFADDTAVIGRITGGDEAAYRKEVDSLVAWCTKNNLTLNTDKTKEMIVDMRKERRPHQPLFIRDLEVERVSSFKYLGVHISDDLTWTLNTTYVLKRAQQRLYFLRRLRKFGMSPRILSNFYSCIIESILTSCITVWYGSTTVKDRKRLQRVVKTATKITKMAQPSLQSIYNLRVHRRAASIIKDPTHPQHGLFTLLPSGRRYRSVKCRTTRLKNSFFPTAIRLLNS